MDEFEDMKTQSEIEAEAAAAVEVENKEGDTVDGSDAKPEEQAGEGQDNDAGDNVVIGLDKGVEGGDKTVEPIFGQSGHTPKGVQDRINSLTKSNRELRTQNEDLERRLKAIESERDKKTELTKEDFIDAGRTDEDYFRYMVDRRAGEIAKKAIEENERSATVKREMEAYNATMDSAKKAFPDFDEVIYGGEDLPASVETASAMRRSKMGAFVYYTLKKIPGFNKAYMNATSDSERIGIINKLDAKLKEMMDKTSVQPTEKKEVTPAPAPAKAATQQPQIREPGEFDSKGAKKPIDPSSCSMEEWMENGF